MAKDATVPGDYLGAYDVRTLFQLVFRRRRLPDEGVQSYAFETLGLPQFTYIGPAVSVREPDPVPPTVGAIYFHQAVWSAGLATNAGYVFTAPLVDQNGKPVPSLGPDLDPNNLLGGPSPIAFNQVLGVPHINKFGPAIGNQPFPFKGGTW